MTKIELLLPPTVTRDTSALDAARRLAKRLPSRQHVFFDSDPKHKGNSKCAVIVDGVHYESRRRAASAHRISLAALAKWLDRGRATYAED